MTFDVLKVRSHIFALETVPVLQALVKAQSSNKFHLTSLAQVRDKLQALCELFEQSGLAEVIEELYLPLFDALTYLSCALTLAPKRFDLLDRALKLINRVKAATA